MKLKYTHWKHGRVEVEVETSGFPYSFEGRAKLYQLLDDGSVWNAGDMINGEAKYMSPVRIGWDGSVRQEDS